MVGDGGTEVTSQARRRSLQGAMVERYSNREESDLF